MSGRREPRAHRHARVSAANPEVLRALRVGQLGEEAGVLRHLRVAPVPANVALHSNQSTPCPVQLGQKPHHHIMSLSEAESLCQLRGWGERVGRIR